MTPSIFCTPSQKNSPVTPLHLDRRSSLLRFFLSIPNFLFGILILVPFGCHPSDPNAEQQVNTPTQKESRSQTEIAVPSTASPIQAPASKESTDETLDDSSSSEHLTSIPSMNIPPPRHFSSQELKNSGMYAITSRRLRLYTDIPPERLEGIGTAVDHLFDEWIAYFYSHKNALTPVDDPAEQSDWSCTGYVISDKTRFHENGMLPQDLPAFSDGLSRGYEFWVSEQKESYYLKHLILHEATHCFVETAVGLLNATWYSEGLAEMFATHLFHNGSWTFKTIPDNKSLVSGWGRISLIRESWSRGERVSISQILQVPGDRPLSVTWYAWCWALTCFLDQHPIFQDRFRTLSRVHWNRKNTEPSRASPHPTIDIQNHFEQLFNNERRELEERWQLFVSNLEYGYDVARSALDLQYGTPLSIKQPMTFTVQSDHGWQNTGIAVSPGHQLHLRSKGKYRLTGTPVPWWSEPNGVSFRYYRGKPLGRLIAAIRTHEGRLSNETSPNPVPSVAESSSPEPLPEWRFFDLGIDSFLNAEYPGTLYLRINDAWGELKDNEGKLTVTINRSR